MFVLMQKQYSKKFCVLNLRNSRDIKKYEILKNAFYEIYKLYE